MNHFSLHVISLEFKCPSEEHWKIVALKNIYDATSTLSINVIGFRVFVFFIPLLWHPVG